MDNMRSIAKEKRGGNSKRWTMFDDDENIHPNLFVHHHDNNNSVSSSNINPFSHGYNL